MRLGEIRCLIDHVRHEKHGSGEEVLTILGGVLEEGNTWNQRIYRIVQLFSLHGQNKDALAKTKLGAWEYDIVGPWYKCNMTDIMAALGLVQFERYPEMLEKRRLMIARYDEAFNNLNADLNLNGRGIELRGLKHYTDAHAGSGHLYILRILGMNREQVNGNNNRMSI